MQAHRVFLSQETLDHWLQEERVSVEGEVMTLNPEGQSFRLITALHFVAEVADGGDEHELVGTVHDLSEIEALGGEHCAGSVILGDNAYDVVEGFVGDPLTPEADVATGSDLAAATRAALGDGEPSSNAERVARFFLGTRQ